MGVEGIAADPSSAGYWGVGSDGGVVNRGGAGFYGSFPGLGQGIAADFVAMSATATGRGYNLIRNVAGFGAAVYAFGDAQWLGNGSLTVGAVAGIRTNPNPLAGPGYWIFDSQGHVDAFGSCQYYGGIATSGISALIPLPNGNGYWLVSQTGSVFNFNVPGISSFTPAFNLVSGDPAPDGQGFYMSDAIGNAYCTGSAKYNGGIGVNPAAFVTGLCRTQDGGGYLMVDFNGDVYTVGDATYAGAL